MILAARKLDINRYEERSWDWSNLVRTTDIEFLMILSVYAPMMIQFDIAAAIGVGMFLSRPEVCQLCIS